MLPGIGIFGCGELVRILVANLRSKGFRVEAIWSHCLETAQQMARELDIKLATDVIDRVLLESSIQLIVIACPPHLHEQIATKACGIGKHVLCDCPPALSYDQMLAMKKAAFNYPSLITIFFNTLRFLPAFVKMKSLIADGYIGQINVINCNVFGSSLQGLDNYSVSCDELMGGGLLSTIGTHVIDIITFVTELRAKRVTGIVKSFNQLKDNVFGLRRITADDFVTFQMEMQNSLTVANVTLNSHYCGKFSHEILICGSKGYLVCRSGDLYAQLNSSGKEELLFADSDDPISDNCPYGKGLSRMLSALKNAFQFSPETECMPNGFNDGDGHPNNGSGVDVHSNDEILHRWAKEAVGLAANFEDGLYVQAVIEAIKYSSKNREWVRIKYDMN
ncbi:glucose-fructose oxidoreductase domain-containing protein 2-like [Oppia nitens]|uniref:glucose-fructose oxidoreductase domain-containing protein 2-like n=1 Tax=Oppia nitens TaxID=1686743 RepID=UPI0023DC1DA6|nr:glucose-fructose oxidoreductase domain-containing protein 2-like [Oppia nitens]